MVLENAENPSLSKIHRAIRRLVDEVVNIMRQSSFTNFSFRQTIFRSLSETDNKEPVKPGYGEGSFVEIRGRKISKRDV
jgi:hypothetical protein